MCQFVGNISHSNFDETEQLLGIYMCCTSTVVLLGNPVKRVLNCFSVRMKRIKITDVKHIFHEPKITLNFNGLKINNNNNEYK